MYTICDSGGLKTDTWFNNKECDTTPSKSEYVLTENANDATIAPMAPINIIISIREPMKQKIQQFICNLQLYNL